VTKSNSGYVGTSDVYRDLQQTCSPWITYMNSSCHITCLISSVSNLNINFNYNLVINIFIAVSRLLITEVV
jgi:hypothetical protein